MAQENYMNQGHTGSPQAGAIGEQNTSQQSESGLADRPRSSERATKHLKSSNRVTGGEVWNDAKERFQTLKHDTDDYVRKNPAKAVFTALGIGFVLGLIRRR